MMEAPLGGSTSRRLSEGFRRLGYIVAAVAVAAVVAAAVALAIRHQARQEFASRRVHDLCAAPPIGRRYQPVTACRVASSHVHLAGGVDADLYALLSTGTGERCLRIDYRNTGVSRQYTSTVTEVDADGCRGITGAERSRLRRDLRARGGVDPEAWTLDFGDG